ncbi:hypothetical protein [uncultured Aquimarina sp.]|uniref:hypothetical protein n=1 Tax=uncultured Aquimarina sp. TaxID=575652 RepID=UPI0026143D1B|nr:hypothetical protein [uncultured Aquimarina sp.]
MKKLSINKLQSISGSGETEDAFIAGLTCGAAIFMPISNGVARIFGRAIPILSCYNYVTSH